MRTKTETVKTEETKEKFNLTECFVLWLNEAKSKKEYLKGHLQDGTKIVGFFNEKEDTKEPKLRIYTFTDKGEIDLEVISLWESTSQKGNVYLSGKTNDDEKIIAYYGDKKEEKRPYIRGYYKES